MKTLLKNNQAENKAANTICKAVKEDEHSLNYLNYNIPEALLAVKYSEKLILTLRIHKEHILVVFCHRPLPSESCTEVEILMEKPHVLLLDLQCHS